MKFTWGWLKDHLETDADMGAVVDALSMLGLEVENVEDKRDALAPFTIARILEAKPHPNADNLRLCRVDTGQGEVEVVCGAPNAEAGLVGVFAPVGAYVPGIDLTLSEAEIRGVVSRGMLCSEREMMLSDEHDGIIALPEDAPLGESFAAWGGYDDPVIEIAITPNRGDCLGVRGIARDLAAAGYGALKPLKIAKITPKGKSAVAWKIDLPKGKESLCPRIAGRGFRGLKNGDAPLWMQRRLRLVGQRPISALVDITNYIMLDLGRPLHAYDAGRIQGDSLTVRLAKKGEKFAALNEKTYTLDDTMLVLADGAGVDGLAGIMGGARTSVDEATTDIFLEMAIFDAVSVAMTGRKLNLHSDSRYRFERGLDASALDWALDYITQMVLDICGGEASDVEMAGVEMAGKGVDSRTAITYHPAKCEALTSVAIAPKQQQQILTALGFTIKADKTAWQVIPPPWRGDIVGAADLVEEVVRISGYDQIPELSLPQKTDGYQAAVSPAQKRPFLLRRLMAARGLHEVVGFTFIDAPSAARFGGGGAALHVVNPISTDLAVMRPSLLAGLLNVAAANGARGEHNCAVFEFGAIFTDDTPEGQANMLGGLRRGMTAPREWTASTRAVDWLDAKADALAALGALGVKPDNLQIRTDAPEWYHPGQSGTLNQGKAVLAHFGTIHPAIAKHHELDDGGMRGGLVGFEVLVDAVPLPRQKTAQRQAAALSPYQAVSRDFAFVVDAELPAEQLLRAINGAGKPLIREAVVFDIYVGKGIPQGKKSMAVAATFQPTKATLTEAEIEATANAIIAAVAKHCGGELRA